MKALAKETGKSFLLRMTISGIVSGVFTWTFLKGTGQDFFFGFLIGIQVFALISLFSGIVKKRLRRSNILLSLFIGTISHILILGFAIFSSLVVIFDFRLAFMWQFLNIKEALDKILIGFAFGFGMSFLFHIYEMFDTLLGRNFLFRIMAGRYNHPFEEQRFFMFLDIEESTALAEKLGHKRFLSLLNDFFYDLAEPVTATRGEIYKYVGDEAIVSWSLRRGARDAAPLRCFFLMREQLERKRSYYLKSYGIVPGFRAAVHGGVVVTGEMGFIRKEIAYVGDVLNTAARLEQQCKLAGRPLIVSAAALEMMRLPSGFRVVPLEPVFLRGKAGPVAVATVEPLPGKTGSS